MSKPWPKGHQGAVVTSDIRLDTSFAARMAPSGDTAMIRVWRPGYGLLRKDSVRITASVGYPPKNRWWMLGAAGRNSRAPSNGNATSQRNAPVSVKAKSFASARVTVGDTVMVMKCVGAENVDREMSLRRCSHDRRCPDDETAAKIAVP